MVIFSKIECNYYCHHNGILSLLSNTNIFIWLEVMLLMTKYSNEVSFIDLVNIQIQLNNFKCRRFFGTPFRTVIWTKNWMNFMTGDSLNSTIADVISIYRVSQKKCPLVRCSEVGFFWTHHLSPWIKWGGFDNFWIHSKCIRGALEAKNSPPQNIFL